MTRSRRLIVAAAIIGTFIGGGTARAFAPPGPGENAPGQPTAVEQCLAVVDAQTEAEIAAGGGPKEGIPAPTNCDHFFQTIGVIGNP